MTDIPTTLANLSGELTSLQTALANATAQGGKASSVAAAIRAATAAVTYLSTRTGTQAQQAAADDALVTAGLAARATALAGVTAARSAGAHPPLADATAAALKTATAAANGVSEGDLDSKGVAAVTTLDTDIATLGDAERTALKTAQDDLTAKQALLADARAKAEAVLAAIQASGAALTARLAAANASLVQAQTLDAAADKASHRAAVVAYADYTANKTALVAELSGDPDGSVAKGKWTTAKNAWLSALADAAAAEEAVIEKQLAVDTKMAEKTEKLATRNADAAAAVLAAIP